METKKKKTWQQAMNEDIKGIDLWNMAVFFHKTYENQSKEVGWKTQEKCRVAFQDLPEKNRIAMLRTCALVIEWINKNQEDI